MGTASADSIFWGFVHYVKHNPFNTFGSMTAADFDNMVALYAAAN